VTDVDDIAVGWTVYETALPGSDYELRGGTVIEVPSTPDGPLFTTMKQFRGQLRKTQLRADQIDVGTSLRPSEQQPGVLKGLIERILKDVPKESSRKFTDHQRWLIAVAYQLSLKA
jgi:hypothetical protein